MDKRILCVTYLICLSTCFLQAQDKPRLYPFEGLGTLRNASDNGHWAVGAVGSGEETENGSLVQLMDLTTGKVVALPLAEEQREYGGSTFDVSDDGKTVAGSFNGYAAYYRDGRWHTLPVPEGYENYKGVVEYMSADGRWMIGYLFNSSWSILSMLWKDGEIANLTDVPGNGQAKYLRVSGDGRKVFLNGGNGFYIYDTEHSSYERVEYRLGTNEVAISNNGRYVGGFKGKTEYNGGEWPSAEYTVSYLYDTETKVYKEYDEPDEQNISVAAVGNDGTLYGASPMYPPLRTLYIHSDNGWIELETILSQQYGMSFTAGTGFDYSGTPMSISNDGCTLSAFSVIGSSCYSLTLPEPFGEVANRINLLSAYKVEPEEGSDVSRMRSITITFERKVTIASGAKAYLYKDGNVVASTLSIEATDNGGRSIRLAFPRDAYLDPGCVHVLTIPAGTFTVEGKNIDSPEINVKYMGRNHEPVKMVNVSPADGSSVAELGYYNVMMMQFDASLKVVEGKTGELYKIGVEEPIANLNLAATGKLLFAYPATTQKLIRGSDYVVKIPAGAVTDVMGYCSNEALEVNYSGAFVVKSPETNSEYVFFDDFSNPNNSIGNFILYDGDRHTPTTEMQYFGFTSGSTPWNFTIRDDGAYDYCAASHSCYTPSGQSEDWMVIPQQYVANKYYFLTFKSQSYRTGCTDKLKVYVWENEEYISSLSPDIADAIRNEGKLVYAAVESPGRSEENLAGDWVEHSISLEEFAGKNIYIAFLNDNEAQSMVFIDDIGILYKGNILTVNTTDELAVAQDDIEVRGNVKIVGEGNFDKITVSYLSHDKTVGDTLDITIDPSVADSYDFSFPKHLPLVVGKQTGFDITAVAGEEVQTITSYVKNVSFLPQKRIVIEEGTGSWCGNCPLGTLAIEYLERLFPDKVIPVCIHNGDTYAFDDYNSFLGFSAYPMGRINRSEGYLSPMITDKNGNYVFVSESGDQTFADIFAKELETLAEAALTVGHPEYDDMTGLVSLPVTTRFAVDVESPVYNILTVILEDSLVGIQSNYFSNLSDSNLGEWASGGEYGASYVRYHYKDVARACVGLSLYGQSGLIPDAVKCDTNIENTIVFSIPSTVNNLKNIKFVCMLINTSTGRIINADRVSLYSRNDEVDGIEPASLHTDIAVHGGRIYVGGSTEQVNVYTLQGMKIENEHLGGGIYVVDVCGQRCKVFVK